MKKQFYLLLWVLCTTLTATAQTTMKGVVLDQTDSSFVAGAVLKLISPPKTLIANEQGAFAVQLPVGRYVVKVNRVGYKPLTLVVNLPLKKALNIYLKRELTDIEVVTVNTGYSQIPKERATGSFALITNSKLNEQVSLNLLSKLEAVSNSLMADRSTSLEGRLMVRGLSTITGPKEPLIILDNFPYDGNLNNINPNDIESVTLLKDAAAASIWGARAGNGVIVITSKKARYNSKFAVQANASITIAGKPDLSRLPQMTSADFIDVEQMLYEKGYYDDRINSYAKPGLSPVVELLLKKTNGDISATDAQNKINALKTMDIRNDFDKYMYGQTINKQFYLNLSGGAQNFAWRATAGYDDNKHMLAATFRRTNLKFEQTFKPIEKLHISSSIQYTNLDTHSGKPGYGDITSTGEGIYPYAQLADVNGNAVPLVKSTRLDALEAIGRGELQDWKYYPLTDYKETDVYNDVRDIRINAGINYKLPFHFSADVKYQYEQQRSAYRRHYGANSYAARNMVNTFASFDGSGKLTYNVPQGGILDNSASDLRATNLRGQLNYNYSQGDHEINAFIGGEFKEAITEGSSSRLYGYNDNLLTIGLVDHLTPYPSLISGSSSYIPNGDGLSAGNTRFISLFSNAAYNYKQRYTVSLSARKDGSNLFGMSANNRWNPLWSAGVAWVLSEENFYRPRWLPYLKLRATYGASGNVDPGMSAVTTVHYLSAADGSTGLPYARFENYYNPELRWETSKMLNLGLDFALAKQRVSGSIEYYRKKGVDLFGRAVVDYTGGVGPSTLKNVAKMHGNGLDIQLTTQNVTGNFSWHTNWNFTLYKDKVDDYYLLSKRASSFMSSAASPRISGLVGKPVYSIYTYKWGGLDPATGDPQGFLNGELSKDYLSLTSASVQLSDLVYHGSALPTVYGNIGNSFKWKRFSLDIQISYKLGYYFRRNSIEYDGLFATWYGHADFGRRWQSPGDEQITNVPSMVYPSDWSRDGFYRYSEALVSKGDHIRLQYVNLGYTLTKENWKRNPFRSLKVFCSLSNGGILWAANKEGIDPDYGNSQTAILPVKTIATGINVSF